MPGKAFLKDGAMYVQGHVYARIHRADGTSFVRDKTGCSCRELPGPGANGRPPRSPRRSPRAARCLHLELGPLDLDLLGLVVHLDPVHLDITAVPGAGNLLGNLLCAVAGLLDGTRWPVCSASSPTCSPRSSRS